MTGTVALPGLRLGNCDARDQQCGLELSIEDADCQPQDQLLLVLVPPGEPAPPPGILDGVPDEMPFASRTAGTIDRRGR